MVLATIFKVSRDDPYKGFAMYLFLSISFVFYANNYMDNDEEYQQYMSDMSKKQVISKKQNSLKK